jgi:hypothetical protein
MIHNISLARTGSPWWLVELGGESFASVIEIPKLEMCHRTMCHRSRQFDFASLKRFDCLAQVYITVFLNSWVTHFPIEFYVAVTGTRRFDLVELQPFGWLDRIRWRFQREARCGRDLGCR